MAAAADGAQTTRGRGGRPRSAEPRTHRVVVHLSDAELAALAGLAAGRPLPAYLRDVALARRLRGIAVPPVNAAVAEALGAIGNNLNQLARSANGGLVTGVSAADLDALRAEVQAAWRAVLGREGAE